MKKKKRFDPVKQVKSLSRVLVKSPPGKRIPSKKEKLLGEARQKEAEIEG